MNEIAYGLVRSRDVASLLDNTLPERSLSQITGLSALDWSIWSSRGSRPILARWGEFRVFAVFGFLWRRSLPWLLKGRRQRAFLALYPDLEADDVREALLFAAEAVRERALPLAAGE
jgi:hypothetical protein